MFNNDTILLGTTFVVTCVGLTIYEAKKGNIKRTRLEENELLLSCINDMERFTDRKPKHIAYDVIYKRIKNGDYLRNSTTMLADYIQQYEIEQIANQPD